MTTRDELITAQNYWRWCWDCGTPSAACAETDKLKCCPDCRHRVIAPPTGDVIEEVERELRYRIEDLGLVQEIEGEGGGEIYDGARVYEEAGAILTRHLADAGYLATPPTGDVIEQAARVLDPGAFGRNGTSEHRAEALYRVRQIADAGLLAQNFATSPDQPHCPFCGLLTPVQQDTGPELRAEDLQWEFFRVDRDPPHLGSRGVKVRHVPSGVGGIGALPKSQLQNRALALTRLKEALSNSANCTPSPGRWAPMANRSWTGPCRMDCPEKCDVPAGATIAEVPTPRHNWGDVVRCPNDACGQSLLVVKNERAGEASDA